ARRPDTVSRVETLGGDALVAGDPFADGGQDAPARGLALDHRLAEHLPVMELLLGALRMAVVRVQGEQLEAARFCQDRAGVGGEFVLPLRGGAGQEQDRQNGKTASISEHGLPFLMLSASAGNSG